MRPQIVKIVTTCVAVFVNVHSWSQQAPPPPQRTPPPGLPIDSGLIFLVLSGLLLGIIFLLRKKRA